MVPGFLVISQPDLGTGLTLILLGLSILFFVGISMKFVIFSILISISSVPFIWQQLYEYQKNRILVFLNPEMDSLGSGYQIIQSKIAIGSGGLFGKGYLLGTQSRLNYLPEKHTDFIFTSIFTWIHKDDKITNDPNQDHRSHFLIMKNLNIFLLTIKYYSSYFFIMNIYT